MTDRIRYSRSMPAGPILRLSGRFGTGVVTSRAVNKSRSTKVTVPGSSRGEMHRGKSEESRIPVNTKRRSRSRIIDKFMTTSEQVPCIPWS